MENSKCPFTAWLFSVLKILFARGKSSFFLLNKCGNLCLESLLIPWKPHFCRLKGYLEFSTLFSTSFFGLFPMDNSKLDFFGDFFRVFNKCDIFDLHNQKPFCKKDVYLWNCGKILVKSQLFHKFSTPVENLVENLILTVDSYAWPIISFFISLISKENMGSSWYMEVALL